MPSRAQLELRAAAVGVTAANYPNDSVLEQRVIFQEKNATAAAGTLATSTLTSTGVTPTNGDTITIGSRTYTLKTALTEAKATITLTSNNTNVSDNDVVTINSTTYRFKTTMQRPGDVQIGASADASLTSLANAINGAGTPGTDYVTGTPATPGVSSSAVSSHILTLSATTAGTAGNSFVLSTTAATLTAGNSGLFAGGVNPVANEVLIGAAATNSLDNIKSAINGTAGAGSTYSSGTAANPDVTAGAKTSTTLVITATQGSVTNTATTKSAVTLSWTGATMGSGVRPQGTPSALTLEAESGGAQV